MKRKMSLTLILTRMIQVPPNANVEKEENSPSPPRMVALSPVLREETERAGRERLYEQTFMNRLQSLYF